MLIILAMSVSVRRRYRYITKTYKTVNAINVHVDNIRRKFQRYFFHSVYCTQKELNNHKNLGIAKHFHVS